MFVVWEWKSHATVTDDHENNQEESHKDFDIEDEGVNSPESSDSGETEIEVPHTVLFKCIGAVRDTRSQNTLRLCRDRMARMASGWTVPVRMKPEPTNVRDARAISFECEIDSKWKRVDYVISEILDEVHAAMSARKIMSIKFDWVRYI